MTSHVLLFELRLVDRRWHGVGDWPPSPFRVFQALVAGAYGGRWRSEDEKEKDAAFRWFEKLPAPIIAAPQKADLHTIAYFVPNNDLDAVAGDPRRIADVRIAKTSRPILIENEHPFLYVWPFEEGLGEAERLVRLAERLHTFGRGIDAAFARGEIIDGAVAETRLQAYDGAVSVPSSGGRGNLLPCATEGSLDSLKRRHSASAMRFNRFRQGRAEVVRFRQPPKALFRPVSYDCPPARLLFELRPADGDRPFRSRPQEDAAVVVMAIRELIRRRLQGFKPREVERFVVGRGAGPRDAARRIRIIPLPSIGHLHADPAIRRILIEIPPDSPIPAKEISWAVSGQELADSETGVLWGTVVAPSAEPAMLRHYGVAPAAGTSGFRRWCTVTPCVLPEARLVGRISGLRLSASNDRAAAAVAQALRHVGITSRNVTVRVQSEPFHTKGARAEAFAPDRFEKWRLRHVEVTLSEPVTGPLVVGDGRWLGLGVMRPVRLPSPSVHVFWVDSRNAPAADLHIQVARALRRAVMARANAVAGRRLSPGAPLPTFFSGHMPDGSPARSGQHAHLFFLCDDVDGDGRIDRLAVVAPDLVDRNPRLDRSEQRSQYAWLQDACSGLTSLVAGKAGVLRLTAAESTEQDPLFGKARVWTSRTPYCPTRHPRKGEDPKVTTVVDLLRECERRGLPRPQVDLLNLQIGPKGGARALARLRFQVAIPGPVLLGALSHFGAGLFCRSSGCAE